MKSILIVIIFIGLAVGAIAFRLNRRHKLRRRQQTRTKPKTRLAAFVGQQLTWTQSAFGIGDAELHAGSELVATLDFQAKWSLSAARGASADGCWMFRSVLGGDVKILTCDPNKGVGHFNCSGPNSGTVNTPDRRMLRLVPYNSWMSTPDVKEIQNESGESLVRLTTRGGWTRTSATVVIQPIAARMPELPWMVLFVWYLRMKDAGDTYTST